MGTVELLLSIVALIDGGLQLTGGPGQIYAGWISIGLGLALLIHLFFSKKQKSEFERLAKTLDGLREKAENGLERVKGKDETTQIWKDLFPIQGFINEVGKGLKEFYTSEAQKKSEKTDRQIFEDYLQRQINWFEKLIRAVEEKGRVTTQLFNNQMYWEHQTLGGIEVCAGKDVAEEIKKDFERYHQLAENNENERVELHFQLERLKTLKSNIRTVPPFDMRDLKKFEMENEP